jgi:hypothetical protein
MISQPFSPLNSRLRNPKTNPPGSKQVPPTPPARKVSHFGDDCCNILL